MKPYQSPVWEWIFLSAADAVRCSGLNSDLGGEGGTMDFGELLP